MLLGLAANALAETARFGGNLASNIFLKTAFSAAVNGFLILVYSCPQGGFWYQLKSRKSRLGEWD